MPREDWVKTLPRTVIASCVVLLDDEGRLLLLRYGPGQPGTGRWWLPGGMLDHGEDPHAAARRETYEEIGITLEPSLRFLGTDHRTDVGGTGPAVDFFFQGDLGPEDAPIRLSDEHDRYAWMSPEELDALPLAAEPEVLLALYNAALTDTTVYLREGNPL